MVRIDLLTIVSAVLPVVAGAHAISKSTTPAWIQWLQHHDLIQDGMLALPFEIHCGVENNTECTALHELANSVNEAESTLFCTLQVCSNQLMARYDPSTDLCRCPTLDENSYFPFADCNTITTCEAPLAPYFDVDAMSCVCSIPAFAATGGYPSQFEPNHLKEQYYGPRKNKLALPNIGDELGMMQDGARALRHINTQLSEYARDFHTGIAGSRRRYIDKANLHELMDRPRRVGKFNVAMRKKLVDEAQAVPSGAVSLAPLPTYIPPPDIQVTDELIQESLLIQPQQVATVASVVPYFADGVITFLVQLDGPISQTLALNATDSLPCGNIGVVPQSTLMLVPSVVNNGTTQTVLPDCLILAINTYSPKYITYWIQREDGSVFSLLSDNQVHAIDQLDTSQPASLAIRVAPANNTEKRHVAPAASVAGLKRTQIFAVSCDSHCPFYHMEHIKGSDGHCGCIFKGADQYLDNFSRGVEQPTPYTATMTANACAAMTCINNGGKPALFNPFTLTCWCAAPTYVETNDNAYDGGL